MRPTAGHTLLWVEQYNCTRPHGGIGGQTPLERWQADPVELRPVPDEALYDAMLVAKRTHKVGKNGVRFRNRDYVAAELNPHVGRSVQLRYLPHDDSFIEVFNDDKHVATGTAVTRLTPEQRRELLAARRRLPLFSCRLPRPAQPGRLGMGRPDVSR